jgi:thiamine transport system permease protein
MPVALERYIGNRSIGPSLGPATAMATVLLAVTSVSFVVIERLGVALSETPGERRGGRP